MIEQLIDDSKYEVDKTEQKIIKVINKLSYFIHCMVVQQKNSNQSKNQYINNEKRRQALNQLVCFEAKDNMRMVCEFQQEIKSLCLLLSEQQHESRRLLLSSELLIQQYIQYLANLQENNKQFDKNIEIPDPRDLQERLSLIERKRENKINKEIEE